MLITLVLLSLSLTLSNCGITNNDNGGKSVKPKPDPNKNLTDLLLAPDIPVARPQQRPRVIRLWIQVHRPYPGRAAACPGWSLWSQGTYSRRGYTIFFAEPILQSHVRTKSEGQPVPSSSRLGPNTHTHSSLSRVRTTKSESPAIRICAIQTPLPLWSPGSIY